jgi:hypothetical protein
MVTPCLSKGSFVRLLLISAFFAVLVGSRLSYFIFRFGERYAPEPFLMLGVLLLATEFRVHIIVLFRPTFVWLILLIYLVIVCCLSSPYTLTAFFEGYANFRSIVICISVPIAMSQIIRFSPFGPRIALQGMFIMIAAFSVFSILLGISSIFLGHSFLADTLTSYGGLRSIQPFIAPYNLFIALTAVSLLRFDIPSRIYIIYSILSASAALLLFFVGLYRVSLLPIFYITIITIILISFSHKHRFLTHRFIFSLIFLAFLGAVFFLFLPSLQASILSMLSVQTFEHSHFLKGFLSKDEIFLGFFDRASTQSPIYGIRFFSMLIPFLYPLSFIFPSGLSNSYIDNYISSSVVEGAQSPFVGVLDSGILYLAASMGLPLFILFLLFLGRRYIRLLSVVFHLPFSRYSIASIVLSLSSLFYLLNILYSTSPFAVFSTSFHFSITIGLAIILPISQSLLYKRLSAKS